MSKKKLSGNIKPITQYMRNKKIISWNNKLAGFYLIYQITTKDATNSHSSTTILHVTPL